MTHPPCVLRPTAKLQGTITLAPSALGANGEGKADPMVPNPDNSLPPFGQDAMALRCGPNPPFPGNFSGCVFMDMSEIEVYGLQSS